MGRRPDFTDISPFDPNWRQYFKDRETAVRLVFEPEWSLPQNPQRGWIVEDLLPRGFLALLAGKPKAGKTCLCAALAHAVSQGIPFAGMNATKTPVLYFAAEEWRHAIDPYLPLERENLWIGHAANFRIDSQADLWGLRLAIDHYRAGLIVVDPLLAAVDGGDFGNARRARNALTGLKALCMEKGVAAIVVHHAKERRGLARRVAENPQLAATASLNVVLNHRPLCGKRLVTLALQGRGPWASRTIKLLSDGPCQYSGHPSSSPRGTSRKEGRALPGDEEGQGEEQEGVSSTTQDKTR